MNRGVNPLCDHVEETVDAAPHHQSGMTRTIYINNKTKLINSEHMIHNSVSNAVYYSYIVRLVF